MPGFRPTVGSTRCPCGGGPGQLRFDACCRPLLRGERLAATAEQLMRSRYSAFALEAVDYLIRTHQPAGGDPVPEAELRRDLRQSCRAVRWLRLEVLATEAGGIADLEGTVTFRAHYSRRGGGFAGGGAGPGVLQERSRFAREGGRLTGPWIYLEALELLS